MSATSIGALLGAAIDGADGEDGVVDGALFGAIAANLIKVAVPLAIVGGAGFYLWRKAGQLKAHWAGAQEAAI